MSSLTLSFNDVNLTPVVHNDNQIWLTSKEIAKALGYKNSTSINKIYNANADEFTSDLTTTVDMFVQGFGGGNSKKLVRIFSLRGCHLLGMFARTDIAKRFRIWVLDVLGKEVSTRTDAKQRESLITACDKLAIGNTLRSDVYTMIANHFGYEKVTQIPAPLLPEAVAFVYEMILSRQKPVKVMGEDEVMNNLMWKDIGFAKTEEVCLITQELSSLLARVSLKVLEIKDSHKTIFDSFDGQTHKCLSQSQVSCVRTKTQNFVNKK